MFDYYNDKQFLVEINSFCVQDIPNYFAKIYRLIIRIYLVTSYKLNHNGNKDMG